MLELHVNLKRLTEYFRNLPPINKMSTKEFKREMQKVNKRFGFDYVKKKTR